MIFERILDINIIQKQFRIKRQIYKHDFNLNKPFSRHFYKSYQQYIYLNANCFPFEKKDSIEYKMFLMIEEKYEDIEGKDVV
jgi:hypothetical protein